MDDFIDSEVFCLVCEAKLSFELINEDGIAICPECGSVMDYYNGDIISRCDNS